MINAKSQQQYPSSGARVGSDAGDTAECASYANQNRGLATYYPSAGVRRWQTFSEQGLDQRIIKQCTFRIPNIGLHYQTGANTNNFVASLTYRFGPLPADLPPSPEPRAP